MKIDDSNITFNLTSKICIQNKNGLTDIGWHVSITYMIFNI